MRAMLMTPHTCKNQGHRSVGSKDLVETNGQTDAIDSNTFAANAKVGKNSNFAT